MAGRAGWKADLAFEAGPGHWADVVLTLSPKVLTHQLVRLIPAEQVFRALSILKGTGYHHGRGGKYPAYC
jgi:hypothetical protein